jgi:hypothetical protein
MGEAMDIGDVQKETGVQLALPSYLPEGTSNSFVISASERVVGNADYVAVRIIVYPAGADGLGILITESKRKPDQPTPRPDVPPRRYPPGSEFVRIGTADVACWHEVLQSGSGLPDPTPPEPTENPGRHLMFKCGWDTDELLFDTHFVWSLAETVPGEIAPERREEAMKVITSMIEEPYIP